MLKNEKPENPSAFPLLSPIDKIMNEGMTLRDYFANSASKIIPIEKERGFQNPTTEDYDTWARKCYKRADALLKQRIK